MLKHRHQPPPASCPKHKERRIVTWTTQEDDILRQQISIHGTENWTAIASKFNDKTTRQCRRRWYTYLNSDFKRGGWSPEEDLLLCEAQKMYGNRWTEIAKVVSGRTDNAVKNRFTTLCKQRAKKEALSKENNTTTYFNANNKRAIASTGITLEEEARNVTSPLKKMRMAHIPSHPKTGNIASISDRDVLTEKQHLRAQFTVFARDVRKIQISLPSNQVSNMEVMIDGDEKTRATFLKKDDPKILSLMQQAELLSSLATKVKTDDTEQSLENAWKIFENFFNKRKDNEVLQFNVSQVEFPLDQLKDLVEDLKSSNQQTLPTQRQPDLYDSPTSSDYSTGSTILSTSASDQVEQTHAKMCTLHEDVGLGSQSAGKGGETDAISSENKALYELTTNQESLVPCVKSDFGDGDIGAFAITEFGSPLQMTPAFRSLAATIPSPQFSESERHFLMKTLGIDSPAPAPAKITDTSQPPPCRRALVHIL